MAATNSTGLRWGAVPLPLDGDAALHDAVRARAQSLQLARPGDYLLLVRGFHRDPALNAPSVTVLQV